MIGRGSVLSEVTEMGFCFGLSALAFEVFPGEHLAHIEGLALASASIGIYPSKV